MPLTGPQRAVLEAAILETFNESDLVQFVQHQWSLDLYTFIGRGQPFNNFVYQFVDYCEKQNRTDELLPLLVVERPKEERFRKLADALVTKEGESGPKQGTGQSRPIRLYSDLASSNRGEITVLAIVETGLSVALYVGIAYWFETVRHIVIAAVLAPLWLLRTRGSVRLGVRWLVQTRNCKYYPIRVLSTYLYLLNGKLWAPPQGEFQRRSRVLRLMRSFVLIPGICLIILPFTAFAYLEFVFVFLIRCFATVVSLAKHPLIHVVAIRKNWKRLILATDVGSIPEWLPGAEHCQKLKEYDQHLGYSIPVSVILEVALFTSRSRSTFERITSYFTGVFYILFFYCVPLLLRTAIKGVSILYTPLFLVIASDPINRKVDLGTHFYEMQHDHTAILKRVVAFLAIGSFLLTILFGGLAGLVPEADAWVRSKGKPVLILLVEYYFPTSMRSWQLVSMVNGLLFLYLSWFFAPKAANRLDRGIWKPADVRSYLNGWIGVQMALSVYSVMCAVMIFVQYFLHGQFPPDHWQWFPMFGW